MVSPGSILNVFFIVSMFYFQGIASIILFVLTTHIHLSYQSYREKVMIKDFKYVLSKLEFTAKSLKKLQPVQKCPTFSSVHITWSELAFKHVTDGVLCKLGSYFWNKFSELIQ